MFSAGGMEKMAGKVTHKPELEAKGERRQVCRDFAVIWSGMTYRFAGRLLGDCFVGTWEHIKIYLVFVLIMSHTSRVDVLTYVCSTVTRSYPVTNVNPM